MFLNKFLAKALSPMIVLSFLVSPLYADGDLVLREGTPLRMKIGKTVSSASAQEGERVTFETLDEVKVNGKVIIPTGSIAQATVTEAVPKRYLAKGGKLNINIDCVRMPNGDRLALRGVQNLKGKGHGAAMTSAIVATAIVFWPAAPLFLFVQGKDITIPQGHEVTVFTNSDYSFVPVEPTEAASSKTRPACLHDRDILNLMKAGFSEEMILAKVQSSPGMYELGTDDLWRLKAAGVPERILMAMLSAPGKW